MLTNDVVSFEQLGPGIWLPVPLPLFYGRLLVEHFRNQDMVQLWEPAALENTFVGLKGYMIKTIDVL